MQELEACICAVGDTMNAPTALVQVVALLQFMVKFRVHGIRNTVTLLPQKVPHWMHSNAVYDSELSFQKDVTVYMYVRVIAKDGTPLMPTRRCGNVRHLLETGMAVAIRTKPFTIRLKYETSKYVQALYAGIDTGRENIGSAVSKENGENVYLADSRSNNGTVHSKMYDRAGFRRKRCRHDRQNKQRKAKFDGTEMKKGDADKVRTTHDCISRKVSYPVAEKSVTHKVIQGKEGKFNNRKHPDGWITPSAKQLVQITMNEVKFMCDTMPIRQLSVERVSFDFQKLANVNIRAWEYGKGPLYGYRSYKDYFCDEQKGKCPFCGKDIAHYHHIMPRHRRGTDTVRNIIGVCESCHEKIHSGQITDEMLHEVKDGVAESFEVGLLNSVMPALIDAMKQFCDARNIRLVVMDGRTTSETRNRYHIRKDHCTDAYCISLAGRNIDPADVKLDDFIFMKRRFKKKSKNIINTLNQRVYYDGKKPVAYNRHRAMDQKTDSLEEYMTKYRRTHTGAETDKHFRSLTVRPAKRTYTFHKNGTIAAVHAGDVVRYVKYNKTYGNTKIDTFVALSCEMFGEGHVKYGNGTQGRKLKFCKTIASGALQCVGIEKTDTYLREVALEEAKRRAARVRRKRTG